MSSKQQSIISNYYKNKDDINLQKINELITDLYLAEGKARDKVWSKIATALKNLGYKSDQVDEFVKLDQPERLVNLINRKF